MARKRTTAEPSGYTILVVDDQEEILISSRLLLEREGHQVGTGHHGLPIKYSGCWGRRGRSWWIFTI